MSAGQVCTLLGLKKKDSNIFELLGAAQVSRGPRNSISVLLNQTHVQLQRTFQFTKMSLIRKQQTVLNNFDVASD